MITLINKGTNINIYNVIDVNGKHLPSIDIEVGEDILNSTEYFDVYNGLEVKDYAPTKSTRCNGAMGSGTLLVICENNG